jgi:hypothetical protein
VWFSTIIRGGEGEIDLEKEFLLPPLSNGDEWDTYLLSDMLMELEGGKWRVSN